MKFEITSRQREIFEQKKFIEFADFFSVEWMSQIEMEVKNLLPKQTRNQEGLFISRDLWRLSKTIRSLVSMNKLVRIAMELFYPSFKPSKFLQLAFDQFVRGTPKTATVIPKILTLETLSCIRPLAGFVFLRLNALSETEDTSIMPQHLTNAIFAAPNYPLKSEEWFKITKSGIFMIAYAKKNGIYLLENQDPCTHDLKRLGYVFGDRLNGTLHPILYS